MPAVAYFTVDMSDLHLAPLKANLRCDMPARRAGVNRGGAARLAFGH
jgi:hypothetical protein